MSLYSEICNNKVIDLKYYVEFFWNYQIPYSYGRGER